MVTAVPQLPGYEQWRTVYGGSKDEYRSWLTANGYANAGQFVATLRGGGTLGSTGGPNLGAIPVPTGTPPGPGQIATPSPTPIAPPSSVPSSTGASAFGPPQVQVPQLLANPTPQGLGGMPMIRDRMMANTLAPFAQANWGVPQVDPRYLTQNVPLAGGATPSNVMVSGPALGLGGPGAEQMPIGLGGKRIPRRPTVGLGTV